MARSSTCSCSSIRTTTFLESTVDASQFALFCTPAVNSVPAQNRPHPPDRRGVRVPRGAGSHAADGLRGLHDHGGGGARHGSDAQVLAFLCLHRARGGPGLFTTRCTGYRESSRRSRSGLGRGRATWGASFISRWSTGKGGLTGRILKQLAIETLCTNRDLPLHNAARAEHPRTSRWRQELPWRLCGCISGPTAPRPSHAHGDYYMAIDQPSLAELSVADRQPRGQGRRRSARIAGYLRRARGSQRQAGSRIRGVVRIPTNHFGTCRWQACLRSGGAWKSRSPATNPEFAGCGAFLLGSVLNEFLRQVCLHQLVHRDGAPHGAARGG